jgi:hypothetical protein
MDSALLELERTLKDAIAGMTPEDLARHPTGKWSSEQILDHLNLTYLATIKNFERMLAAGRPTASGDRNTRRWPRLLITGLGFFPSGRSAPEQVRPRGTPAEQLRREILGNLGRMDELISECERRFGQGRPVTNHPILGPLTAREWRRFHLAHGRHHARQIRRLKRRR